MTSPFSIHNGYTVLILVFISLAALTTAQKSGTSTISNSPAIKIRRDSVPEPCGFVGSSDIYGIGIRIGYYAQAFSIWVANFFVLREARALRAVNALFMFAMCIGLIFMSATPSQTYSVEAYIMIQIILVVWYVGTLDLSKYSRKHWKFNFERSVITNGCFVGMIVYNVWYWWVGLDVMLKTPCGSFGYFLSKVALDGWYRKANMALAIICTCFQFLLECGHLFRTLRHFRCRKINRAGYQGELQRRLESAVDTTTSSSSDYQTELNACSHIQRLSKPASPRSILSINPIPPTSFDEELDNLPKRSPTRFPVVTTSEVKGEDDVNWPDFQELYAADTYISSVLSACPESILTSTRFQITFLHGSIKLYIPYLGPSLGTDPVPLRTCLATILGAIHRHQFNSPAVAIVFSHIYALQKQPFYRYPWLLHRALIEPSHTEQNWRTLATMANIRITCMPNTTRKWYWIPSAVQAGVVTVGLVLSIELTIWWNSITGVNQIGTVGQLVPFVLGVGGLIKVLWSWLRMRFGTEGGDGEGVGEEGPEARLATAYYGRKEGYERGLGIGTVEERE